MFRITHISYMWNDSKICHTVTLEKKKNTVLAISHNLKLNLPESLWYNGSFAFAASPCDTPRDIGKCWHPQSALHKGDLILGWNQHTSAPYLADIQWTATKLNLSAMFKKTTLCLCLLPSLFSFLLKGNNAFCKPNVLQLPKWVCWRRTLTSLQNASFLPIGMLVKQVRWCGGFIYKVCPWGLHMTRVCI